MTPGYMESRGRVQFNRLRRGKQDFQYFSIVPVLHYLHSVLFIKNFEHFS